jgi:hypothetical protein
MLQRVARYHPFLWLGGLTIAIMAVGPFVPLEYDDRGLGTVWFVITYGVTVVFRKAAIVSTALSGSETGAVHTVFTLLLGSALYIAADLALSAGAKRLAKSKTEPVPQRG